MTTPWADVDRSEIKVNNELYNSAENRAEEIAGLLKPSLKEPAVEIFALHVVLAHYYKASFKEEYMGEIEQLMSQGGSIALKVVEDK